MHCADAASAYLLDGVGVDAVDATRAGRIVYQVDPEASTYADDAFRYAEIGERAVAFLFPRQRALDLRPETGPLPRRREAPLDRGLGPVGVAEGGLVTCPPITR